MRRTLVSLTAMFASLALVVAGTTLLGTLLSLRLAGEGLNPALVGVVLMCHAIGFVLGTRVSTRVIHRVGQVRSFAAFAAVACVAALVHPNFVWAPLWALLRVISGFSMAGMVMILESWISGRASNNNRGTLLGVYQLVYFSFAALGQMLVGLSQPDMLAIYSLAAILIVLALVPLSLTREEAPTLAPAGRMSFGKLYRGSPSSIAGALIGGAISSGFLAMAPVYGYATGMSIPQVSVFLTVAVIGAMVMQWPLGRLSDLLDRRRVLCIFAILVGTTAAVGSVVGQLSVFLLYAFTLVAFGINGCLYPVCLSMLMERMETPDPMGASSSLLFVFGLGTCAGPLAAAGTMALLGAHGLFLFMSIAAIALAVLVAVRIRVSDDLPVALQGRFVPMPAVDAAPAMLELDPRITPEAAAASEAEVRGR